VKTSGGLPASRLSCRVPWIGCRQHMTPSALSQHPRPARPQHPRSTAAAPPPRPRPPQAAALPASGCAPCAEGCGRSEACGPKPSTYRIFGGAWVTTEGRLKRMMSKGAGPAMSCRSPHSTDESHVATETLFGTLLGTLPNSHRVGRIRTSWVFLKGQGKGAWRKGGWGNEGTREPLATCSQPARAGWLQVARGSFWPEWCSRWSGADGGSGPRPFPTLNWQAPYSSDRL
jgi:hypothetical protein